MQINRKRNSIPTPSIHQGRQLRMLRNHVGLTQSRLARLASVGRHTVGCWESKPKFQRWSKELRNIVSVLERLCRYRAGQTRARGHGVLHSRSSKKVHCADWNAGFGSKNQPRSNERVRVRCGAKTRKGTPCRLLSEPGKRRCNYHGGKSTGPRTAAGRARISAAQIARWESFRVNKV